MRAKSEDCEPSRHAAQRGVDDAGPAGRPDNIKQVQAAPLEVPEETK